jgi:hypothetical protein
LMAKSNLLVVWPTKILRTVSPKRAKNATSPTSAKRPPIWRIPSFRRVSNRRGRRYPRSPGAMAFRQVLCSLGADKRERPSHPLRSRRVVRITSAFGGRRPWFPPMVLTTPGNNSPRSKITRFVSLSDLTLVGRFQPLGLSPTRHAPQFPT